MASEAENYERCWLILADLDRDMRGWGDVIDDFLPSYRALSLDSREKLGAEIPARTRISLFR